MAEVSALRKHPCPECGGDAEWDPAKKALACPYCGTVLPWTDGEDALVADTVEQWVHALSRLIEDVELRRTLSRNARRAVMEHHSLEQNWWRWPTAWSDAIERFRAKPRLILASA